jgi:sec-independent protein translocase protein TatA
MRLGPTELIIILVLILVLFGGRKLPELAKGLGQGLKEFKSSVRENEREEAHGDTADATPPRA